MTAFYVVVDRSVFLGTEDYIKFNKVFVDTNNGYNVRTGVYTVKSKGIYLIQSYRYEQYNS